MKNIPEVFLQNNPKMLDSSKNSFFWDALKTSGKMTSIDFYEDVEILKVEKEFNSFFKGEKSIRKIPSIIHFIWIGSSLPQKINNLINSWKKHHSNFTFMIWTDEKVASYLFFSEKAKEVYSKARTYAEKSDALRYDILYRFGGIYSDTDVICLKNFESILESGASFFAGLLTNQVTKRYKKPLFLGNAIIGAVKNSPIIKYALNYLCTEEEKPDVSLSIRTGSGLLSEACSYFLFSNDEKIIIFPPSYFYPYPDYKKGITPNAILSTIRNESYCLHLWDRAWNLPQEKELIDSRKKNSEFYRALNCTGLETDYSFYQDHSINKIENGFHQFLLGKEQVSVIPRIFHFIWLGSKLQKKQLEFIDSFKKHHPEYEFRVWTDDDIDKHKWFSKRIERLFFLSNTYAEKADILRYDLLFQYGGIYSDTDVLCLKSFDGLLKSGTSFFAGLETNQLVKKFDHPLYIGNCIFGCRKNSPIMKRCLENLQSEKEAPDLYLPMRTGPGHLSRAALFFLNEENILLFPCSYFYPLPHIRREVEEKLAHSYIRKESYCIHFWDGTWCKE